MLSTSWSLLKSKRAIMGVEKFHLILEPIIRQQSPALALDLLRLSSSRRILDLVLGNDAPYLYPQPPFGNCPSQDVVCFYYVRLVAHLEKSKSRFRACGKIPVSPH